MQYIDVDGSAGKNFELLIMLNRKKLSMGVVNSRENKIDGARRVSTDIQLNGYAWFEKIEQGSPKNGL